MTAVLSPASGISPDCSGELLHELQLDPNTSSEPTPEDVSLYEQALLYDQRGGILIPDKQKQLEGCTVHIASYVSERASHRVGIYEPDNMDPKTKWPAILMTTPLATSAKGHNQEVARQFAAMGFRVIVKGPPRYHSLTRHALTLAEDANEMFELVNEVERSGVIGTIESLALYGESQAAMKVLACLAIKGGYSREIVDSLVVAACYLKPIHWTRPDKQLHRLGGMAAGVFNFVRASTPEQRGTLDGTFNLKDTHHHVAVVPVLTSGEAGVLLDHMDEQEDFSVLSFGKDGNSKPQRSKAEYESRFPNVDVTILAQYGHVDGIMSHETRVRRELMLFEIARRHDMPLAEVEQIEEQQAS